MSLEEINFDGLIGPTHNFGGLSFGNLAAEENRGAVSRPRAAALQGLKKMRAMMALGLKQGVLPPQERPDIGHLRALGFTGSDALVWERACRDAPMVAHKALSASAMWAANAATVSPSADCADGRVHFTPANLHSMGHRALEPAQTTRALKRIFADPVHFQVHEPLPAHGDYADEGAANHMRLWAGEGPGLEVFVYGRDGAEGTVRFPARQTLAACQAIARRHGLLRVLYLPQSAKAIDAGAFHNDVVAVSHERVVLAHAEAFEDPAAARAALEAAGYELVEIPASAVAVSDAVKSYLFNSQLVRAPGANGLTLIAPMEAQETPASAAAIAALTQSGGPITGAHFFDLRESMRNGGGPACLRLRVALTEDERGAMRPGFLLTPRLVEALEAWVSRHYREALAPDDFADPKLIDEVRAALDSLTEVLPLGGDFYPFQRG